MTSGVLTGHNADSGWRANGRGVSVGELDPFAGQLFHIRRPIAFIQRGCLVPKRHRRILPAQVIDKEENDVRAGVFG